MSDILGPANAQNSVTERPIDNRSFSSLDTFFKDCSSPTTEDGTAIQASFFNGLIAAARSMWRMNGFRIDGTTKLVTEDGSDDNGLTKSVQQLVQRGQPTYAEDEGVVNALVATLTPALIELKTGVAIRVKVAHTNTGVSTIDVNGLGVKQIRHPNGAALSANDLIEEGIAWLVYDGTHWQLAASHTDLIGGPGGGSRYICPLTTADASGTATAIVAIYSPTTAAPVAGDFFAIKLIADITGATTINPDGTGAKAIVDSSNVALASGFAKNGDLLLLQYDGAKMRVMNRPPQASAAAVPMFPAIGSYYTMFEGAPNNLGIGVVTAIPGLPGQWKVIQYQSLQLGSYTTVDGGYTFYPTFAAMFQRVS